MAKSARTLPQVIIDKNGKVTKVHKLPDSPLVGRESRISKIGLRREEEVNGVVKKSAHFTVGETVELIKETLVEQFGNDYPNTEFSIEPEGYVGGSSINIKYVDGPPPSEVEHFVSKYETYYGDPTFPPKPAVAEDGTEMWYGPDFIFVQRDISPDRYEESLGILKESLGVDEVQPHEWHRVPDLIKEISENNPAYFRRGIAPSRKDGTIEEMVDILSIYLSDPNANKVEGYAQAH